MEIDKEIMKIVALDRVHVPFSSAEGKLKRRREKAVSGLDRDDVLEFSGERAYARIEDKSDSKKRGYEGAVKLFCEKHPKLADELNELVEEQVTKKEERLYFGMHPGARINPGMYEEVMSDIGFTPGEARAVYPTIVEASRRIVKARGIERSVKYNG